MKTFLVSTEILVPSELICSGRKPIEGAHRGMCWAGMEGGVRKAKEVNERREL